MRTTVIAIRHGKHGQEGVPKNALTPQAREEAVRLGSELSRQGFVVEVPYSSPQGRAVETMLCVMQGAQQIKPFKSVEDDLGDLGMDPQLGPAVLEQLIAAAKKAGIGPEEYFLKSDTWRDHVIRRGWDGAITVREMVESHPGKVIGFVSHGGSRLEATIATLQRKIPWEPDFLMEEGSAAVLIFEDNLLQEVKYLGNLGKTA